MPAVKKFAIRWRKGTKSRLVGRFSTITYDGRTVVDANRLLRSKEVKKKLDSLDRAIGRGAAKVLPADQQPA
jgi:hypothetical protein